MKSQIGTPATSLVGFFKVETLESNQTFKKCSDYLKEIPAVTARIVSREVEGQTPPPQKRPHPSNLRKHPEVDFF